MFQGPVNKCEEVLLSKHECHHAPDRRVNHVQPTSHAPPVTAFVNQGVAIFSDYDPSVLNLTDRAVICRTPPYPPLMNLRSFAACTIASQCL
jgi:hypothetical protein